MEDFIPPFPPPDWKSGEEVSPTIKEDGDVYDLDLTIYEQEESLSYYLAGRTDATGCTCAFTCGKHTCACNTKGLCPTKQCNHLTKYCPTNAAKRC